MTRLAPAAERYNVHTLTREQFLTGGHWRYKAGEHVTILGPTGCGKTTLAYELLGQSAKPTLPGVVLVMKPKDDTATKWNKRLGFRRVRHWPPLPSIWQPRKPNGYTLWPKHTFDPDRDDAIQWKEFRAALLDSYKRGRRILFADETYSLTHELNLAKPLTTIWSKGRSMGTGLWAASQKPTHIPLWAYSMANHLFLYYDPDKRARERFGEIGGIDPRAVAEVVAELGPHQCLYIRRSPLAWCIVDA